MIKYRDPAGNICETRARFQELTFAEMEDVCDYDPADQKRVALAYCLVDDNGLQKYAVGPGLKPMLDKVPKPIISKLLEIVNEWEGALGDVDFEEKVKNSEAAGD